MADAGDFTPDDTTDPDAEPDTFSFCGDRFNIPPTVGTGSLLRFTWRLKAASEQQRRGSDALKRALTEEGRARARQMNGQGELDGSAAIYDLLTSVLGEDQIDRFLSLVDRNGVQVDGLLEVCNRIQGVIAGRPTRQPSGSSDGLQTNGIASTANGSGGTDFGTAPPPALTPAEQQRRNNLLMMGTVDEVAASYV